MSGNYFDQLFGSNPKASAPSEQVQTAPIPVEDKSVPAQDATPAEEPIAALDEAAAEAPDEEPTEESDETPLASAAPQMEEELANPLEAALEVQSMQSIYERLPVFRHGSAEEELEDTSQTFDQLRIAKEEDFPELEDASQVTWKVDYGPVTEAVAKPKKETVGEAKKRIEQSKTFMEKLKKSKDKSPVCYIKPDIRAQKKGEASPGGYKQVCDSYEDAVTCGKVITLFPSPSGTPMERRVTEAGEFVTPRLGSTELEGMRVGFTPALPKIPSYLLQSILAFFREMAGKPGTGQLEALVNIYWDKKDCHFVLDVPFQSVNHVLVNAIRSDLDEQRYFHYMDIHSHNSMPAVFSGIDNRNERATRLYAVVGRLNMVLPEMTVRICNGGTFWTIPAEQVFEPLDFGDYDVNWHRRVQEPVRGATA